MANEEEVRISKLIHEMQIKLRKEEEDQEKEDEIL
jgi:hypothetical protein